MKQESVNDHIDRTIGKLLSEGVSFDLIIDRLKTNAVKFKSTLENDEDAKNSPTRTNYLTWYVMFANKRVKDLNDAKIMASKIGIHRQDKIFKLMKFKEKLSYKSTRKFLEFD